MCRRFPRLASISSAPTMPQTLLAVRIFTSACLIAVAMLARAATAEQHAPIVLWPAGAPNEPAPSVQTIGEEHDATKPSDAQIAGQPVVRWANVRQPTLTIYSPEASRNTGMCLLVCPGGGYHILAMDLEGTEVCEWLNSIGVTGALLKYRVPRREGLPKHAAPMQDAQRAMGILRQRAQEFAINPGRIGMLGFSAGGHLTAAVSTNDSQRQYSAVDDADRQSCRPDFAVLIYPGGLIDTATGRLSTELKVDHETPPTFLAMTADDPVGPEGLLVYAGALKKAGVPVELHLYPRGGHGYGLRRTEVAATSWPDRLAEWLKDQQPSDAN